MYKIIFYCTFAKANFEMRSESINDVSPGKRRCDHDRDCAWIITHSKSHRSLSFLFTFPASIPGSLPAVELPTP